MSDKRDKMDEVTEEINIDEFFEKQMGLWDSEIDLSDTVEGQGKRPKNSEVDWQFKRDWHICEEGSTPIQGTNRQWWHCCKICGRELTRVS